MQAYTHHNAHDTEQRTSKEKAKKKQRKNKEKEQPDDVTMDGLTCGVWLATHLERSKHSSRNPSPSTRTMVDTSGSTAPAAQEHDRRGNGGCQNE